jgi:uncharacterized protein (DUF1330 family)
VGEIEEEHHRAGAGGAKSGHPPHGHGCFRSHSDGLARHALPTASARRASFDDRLRTSGYRHFTRRHRSGDSAKRHGYGRSTIRLLPQHVGGKSNQPQGRQPEKIMPKAYWIVRVSVRDQQRYPEYLSAARPAFEKFGANFIVRGGAYDVMEGTARDRNVVVEFRDRATAMACYQSPEYQAARTIRQKYADADFIIIDGAA